MKKYEKEVIQAQLDNEKAVLKKLEENYKDALDEVNDRIAMLLGRQDADLQHVVYQVEFQKSLKTQIQSILEQLQNNEFETVSEYLTQSYEEGFLGTMYSLQSQGVPLVFPLDQSQVVDAIQNETKLSESLYLSLGKDVKQLNKQIAGEISRGISNAAMYSEIARNIASYARIPKNNAMRIARTEAHRIQNKATMDACVKAKEKGADILRQWDATFDGVTRPTHRELDGQLRELDEPFEVAGKKAMFPGDFGDPAEDCNCRCSLLQRARWNLDSDITKWTKEYGIVTIKAKDYQAFKEEYFRQVDAGSVRQSTQKMKMSTESQGIKWGSKGQKITNEQYKNLMQYARNKNIELSGFKQFDGNVDNIKTLLDDATEVAKKYPGILEGKKRLTISLSTTMDDMDFAKTNGHIVSLNANAYRNIGLLEKEYQKLVGDKWFVQGTDYHSIIKHELGHVIANKYNINSLSLAKEITGIEKNAILQNYIETTLSEYAFSYADGREIIAECFASVYGSKNPSDFALKFVEECGNIVKK